MEATIPPVDPSSNPLAAERLASLEKRLGRVPNMLAIMAQSPAVLDAYLKFSAALMQDRLSARQREQIALAVAGLNGCEYCAAAHAYFGRAVGLTETEVAESLQGRASDERTQALLNLASEIVLKRGHVPAGKVEALRSQGLSDEDFLEVLGQVALNTFSNYFNNLAGTRIDFPKVSGLREQLKLAVDASAAVDDMLDKDARENLY